MHCEWFISVITNSSKYTIHLWGKNSMFVHEINREFLRNPKHQYQPTTCGLCKPALVD